MARSTLSIEAAPAIRRALRSGPDECRIPPRRNGTAIALGASMTTHPVDVGRPAAAPVPTRRYVLVADDAAEMRGLLSDLLEAEGYEVRTVSSGGRALSAMAQRRPDLLITDLFMPGMSGFSLRALMLRRPELAPVPVIVLSAYWHRPSETLDVAEVLTKPLNIDRLLSTVRRLLTAEAKGRDGIPD